jgi:hypothetical protein
MTVVLVGIQVWDMTSCQLEQQYIPDISKKRNVLTAKGQAVKGLTQNHSFIPQKTRILSLGPLAFVGTGPAIIP